MKREEEKKTLVIVESPTKAETIKKYLSKNYTIMASKGHIRDLAEDRLGIDVEHGFQPEYVITEGKTNLIRDLKKKLKASDELLLATDEDREGESISWHLVELLKPSVPYKRMVFHEITRSAIMDALKQGRDLDMNLVRAQEARRIVDRLYGYEVSPVLWRKLSNKHLSGGRVQSVGLRFIVEREMDRLAYKSSTYYDIKADFDSFVATLESVDGKRIATSRDFDSTTGLFNGKAHLLSAEEGEEIIASCRQNEPYVVSSVAMKPSSTSPQPPFTTSTLQQAASSRLHLSSRETMRLAQSLFENGFITYMRTDSVNLSDECISAARKQIENEFGSEYLSPNPRHFKNRSKNAQEAHEAIRPAGDVFRHPRETGLSGRELALYTLIWVRTLASQMANAEKSTTTIKIKNGQCIFSTSGTTVIFPGYLKAYSDDEDGEKNVNLPRLSEGNTLTGAKLSSSEHKTNPPSRYSEASLIKKLEEQGIGRPSTYATIISTLLDRGYVKESDRVMIPTFTGFAVNSYMGKMFSQLVDYSYTSDMEDELDKIAEGEEDSRDYLTKFYYGDNEHKGLEEMVALAKADKGDYKTLSFPNFSGSVTLHDGSTCTYTIKIGPYGAYLATSLKKEDGKQLIVNIPSYSLPGEMTDEDIAKLITDTLVVSHVPDNNEIFLRKGERGDYWQKGEQRVSVPRGKKKAEDYTVEEIEYLFSLPRTVGKDSDGNELVLNRGPYGFYLHYCDENYRVFSAPFNMSEEEALSIVDKRKSSNGALKTFEDYDGKPLSIRRGRYNLYLKWGDKNIRLSRREADSYTQEEVEKLCAETKEEGRKPKDGEVIARLDDGEITIHDGRYGRYLKYNGKNYRIPHRESANVDASLAIRLVKEATSGNNTVDLGMYKEQSVQLVNGRYGYYLKYNNTNYSIAQHLASDMSLESAISCIENAEKAKQEEPVSLGQYEGGEISVLHGRYGYYLKYNGENYPVPYKYKKNWQGLSLEEAIEAIKKKNAQA